MGPFRDCPGNDGGGGGGKSELEEPLNAEAGAHGSGKKKIRRGGGRRGEELRREAKGKRGEAGGVRTGFWGHLPIFFEIED